MIRYNHLPNLQEQFSYEDNEADETRFWIHLETGDLHIKIDGNEKVIPFEVGVRIIDLLVKKQEVFRDSVRSTWYSKIGL